MKLWFIEQLGVILLIGGVAFGGFFLLRQEMQARSALQAEVSELSDRVASTTEAINNELIRIGETLELAQTENTELLDDIVKEQRKLKKVANTVEDLEKLSKIDPELLQKYSKVFFLNEHYAPPRLTTIEKKYTFDTDRNYKIHAEVYPFLDDMLDEADDDGIEILVFSAFRSFNEQSSLKQQYTVTYGAGTANQFSADQGYSEHQLGTAVDLTTKAIGTSGEGFENTEAYEWLKRYAYKYGFILSYPENNQHYIFEPWHWRFVGVDLARDLRRKEKNFYDMDQRDIDEYLIDIFED